MGKGRVSLCSAGDTALDFMRAVHLSCVHVWPHDVKHKDCVVLKHRNSPVSERKLDKAYS